jgi:DNA helicase-2/ATP-dependent DNA helicase PcrA
MYSSCQNLLETLNPHQKQAVSTTNQHLRVLAGAGSGKTQVLVCRIAYLMQTEALSQHQFLAVTFTNKAAHEMRTRLSNLLQQSQSHMWVGTFHSLAHRLLRYHWEAAGLNQNFQVLDASDQQQRIKRLIRQMNLDEGRFPPQQVKSFINQKKDEGLRSHQLGSTPDPYQKVLFQLYQHYETQCIQDNVLDFAELLLRSYELLQKNPDILEHYHNRFRHILVDEFQDTSTMQYAWIKLMTGPQTYLTIVGDDDQSIYSWRGARVENMHRFERDFQNSQTLCLEQNYRSTSTILSAANALIANNQERLGKNLWTQGAVGDTIAVYAAFNDLDEARFIVERIQLAAEAGTPYQDIALLYRSNAQSRILEEALLRASIPYRVYGGLRFFERAEIKDALAYLRLVSHSDDDIAFERVVNTPARGIGEKTLDLIRNAARTTSVSLYEASRQLLTAAALPSRASHALRSFLQLIEQLKLDIKGLTLGDQTEHILEKSSLIAHYKRDSNERAQVCLDNINELIYATRQFSPDSETEDELSHFLSQVALDAGDYQNENTAQTGVQLMTLHAAKGLEFPLVFLTGMEEGLFPSHMSLSEPQRLEEERRLCYVGMTRAMHKLYLTYAEVRRYHGNETYRIPSRFLKEIPEQYLAPVRTKPMSTARINHVVTTSVSNSTDHSIADTEFRIRQRVKHPTFGYGIILNYEGHGDHMRVHVKFDTVGAKWLVLKFAKLEIA